MAQLQSSDDDHADQKEVLLWAEKYFGSEKWPMWKGIACHIMESGQTLDAAEGQPGMLILTMSS